MHADNPTHPLQPRCRGHRKDGSPCTNRACYGHAVCRMHGAGTPRGQVSPHYKDGRYSKALPARLRERYDQAAADPDLLVLRADISVVDTHLDELLSSLDSEGAPTRLAAIRKAAGLYQSTAEEHKAEALAALFATIHASGQGDEDRVWDTIMGALEQRRKLVESERKRLVELNQVISAGQMLILLDQTVAVIKEHVRDSQTLAAIAAGLQRLQHLPERVG